MSDTPETDDNIRYYLAPGMREEHAAVLSDFARKLERERDEARTQVKLLKVENNHNWQAMDIANEVTHERNKWRECAERLASDLERSLKLPENISTETLCEFRRLKEASE
jgi:hypothetical protein